MSDDLLLTDAPVRFRDWTFAPCDLECELRYQSLHVAHATGQIEALRSRVSAEAYSALLDRHVEHVEANRFAFGDTLSLRFLLSDQGAIEYLVLLAGKAGCRAASAQALDALKRKDREAFDGLVKKMIRRDFPNLLPAADSTSPPPGAPRPSITESSSSSPGGPGERVGLRSSA